MIAVVDVDVDVGEVCRRSDAASVRPITYLYMLLAKFLHRIIIHLESEAAITYRFGAPLFFLGLLRVQGITSSIHAWHVCSPSYKH